MPSVQETLYALLAGDAILTGIVADRIFPGQIPDDEAPTPWLFYAVPDAELQEDLDGEGDVRHQIEFHALGDTYATAKGIVEAVKGVLNTYSGGQIRRAFWVSTSEDTTEEGYHHVARFDVWGTDAAVSVAPGSSARIATAGDTITLTAGGHTLTLDPDGLLLDGSPVGSGGGGGSGNLDGGTPDSIYGGVSPLDGGTP